MENGDAAGRPSAETKTAAKKGGRGPGGVARFVIAFVAAISVVAGLECSPRGKASTHKEPPLITAEPKPRLSRSPHAHPRWSWPGMAVFDARLADAKRDAQPIRLVRGKLVKHMDGDHREAEGVVLAIVAEAGKNTFEVGVEMAESESSLDAARFWERSGWTLATGPLSEAREGVPLVFERGTARLRIEPTYVSAAEPLSLDALDDWAYVAALLGSDPPVYDDRVPDPENAEEDIAQAKLAGQNEKALAIYRTWRPMGRCSMDRRPAEVARDYAELCHEMGKLGCFLQLQLRIMGDQFDRVAFSSFGEEAATTEADRLLGTGIDVDSFLVGLAVHFGSVAREGEIAPWRLARSIEESGRRESVAARLAAWAHDGELDEFNRLRAVQMLSMLEEENRLDEESLPDTARLWLVQQK
jgi:hypothetical protein